MVGAICKLAKSRRRRVYGGALRLQSKIREISVISSMFRQDFRTFLEAEWIEFH
jgi:hypothetical protein